MAMKFDNRLKGRLGENILNELLVDAGYVVARIGVEHTVKEIASLTWKQYDELKLDPRIRRLPDFLVMDIQGGETLLTEVKARDTWDIAAIKESITEQITFYREFILVLFVAHPPENGPETASTFLRATKVRAVQTRDHEYVVEMELKDGSGTQDLTKVGWYDLPKIQKYFGKLTQRWDEKTLGQATEMFRRCFPGPGLE